MDPSALNESLQSMKYRRFSSIAVLDFYRKCEELGSKLRAIDEMPFFESTEYNRFTDDGIKRASLAFQKSSMAKLKRLEQSE